MDINKEKLKGEIQDTIIHKELILESCCKMALYFLEQDDLDSAISLLQRASCHDNSKFNKNELLKLSEIYDLDIGCYNDPNSNFTNDLQSRIQQHWENNTHHPEHYTDIHDMPELDLVEMVCDWYARALQYGTNILDFLKIRQENRFHFPEDIYLKVEKYCKILSKNSDSERELQEEQLKNINEMKQNGF